MNTSKLRAYRFSKDAQWETCLFVQADRDMRRATGGIRPFAPYARPGTPHKSDGGHAPAVTRAGEIIWRNNAGAVSRLGPCDDTPTTRPAPFAIGRAKRIVATASGLWVIGDPPESLERYDEETLTRLLTVDVPNAPVIDIANGGRGCILAIAESQGALQCMRIDRAGHVVKTVEFHGVSNATAFVYLLRSQRYVVLAGADHHRRLYWFSAEGGSAFFSLPVAGMRPCFKADVLGSDSREKIFLASADREQSQERPYVVILDSDGSPIGDLSLELDDAPLTGITGNRDSLIVTGKHGLWQFKTADIVPEGAVLARCTIMTPVLFSPDREDRRRWLRVEATSNLPEGTAMEIDYVATDSAAERDRLNAIAMNDSIPANQRVERLLSELGPKRGRTVFRGSAGAESQDAKTFSAKLFDERDRYLWVCITLTAAAGARLPLLSELAVLYPGRTLMEDLPAIYQREEERPDSFLRALVGVLETTTQDLDMRIGSMASQIHPETAPNPWLDFIARWLGVPWDDVLSPDQKRDVMRRAADLAKGRGTREGLEALLECLIPGMPRRFRVMDANADFGFAVLGGKSCRGSSLPAMLGGNTPWHAELDSSAVLGYMRLPCSGQLDDGAWQLAGKIRIDVAATAAERKACEPWLLSLVTEMVPLTARVELHWISAVALRTSRLDGTLVLESAPAPHLGTDAVTGLARLPDSETRLLATGPIIGARLH